MRTFAGSIRLRRRKIGGRAWTAARGLVLLGALAGTAGAAPRSISIVDEAAAVRLVTLDGETTTLAAALGGGGRQNGAIVLFWSMYHPDSRRALRRLDLFAATSEEGSKLLVLAIEIPEYREAPVAIAEFLSRHRVSVPVYVDPGRRALDLLARRGEGPRKLPETYLVLPGGRVELISSGWDEGYGSELGRAAARAGSGGEERER